MICNIKDAYNDPRFDPSHDKQTGYKTKSILCGPIKDQNDKIVGVLQIINKKDDTAFSDLDAEVSERHWALYSFVRFPLLTQNNPSFLFPLRRCSPSSAPRQASP